MTRAAKHHRSAAQHVTLLLDDCDLQLEEIKYIRDILAGSILAVETLTKNVDP